MTRKHPPSAVPPLSSITTHTAHNVHFTQNSHTQRPGCSQRMHTWWPLPYSMGSISSALSGWAALAASYTDRSGLILAARFSYARCVARCVKISCPARFGFFSCTASKQQRMNTVKLSTAEQQTRSVHSVWQAAMPARHSENSVLPQPKGPPLLAAALNEKGTPKDSDNNGNVNSVCATPLPPCKGQCRLVQYTPPPPHLLLGFCLCHLNTLQPVCILWLQAQPCQLLFLALLLLFVPLLLAIAVAASLSSLRRMGREKADSARGHSSAVRAQGMMCMEARFLAGRTAGLPPSRG